MCEYCPPEGPPERVSDENMAKLREHLQKHLDRRGIGSVEELLDPTCYGPWWRRAHARIGRFFSDLPLNLRLLRPGL